MKIKQPLKNAIAKVPVIMQLEALECGAASLAMVFAYYDLWIPLEQLRKECGVSRDGSNMASIYQVATKYGFKPRAFSAKIDRLKEIGTFPAIIFWEYNHFVVLDGFKDDIVYLNDPARGRVRMPVEEFNRSYSQICMFLEPTESFKPDGQPASIMEFVKERLKGSLPMFLLLTITTLIASLTGMLLPAFSRFFVDNLLIRGMSQWSGGFFILLGLTIFSQISSLVIKAVFMLKLQGKMAAVANTSFLWHILRLPVEFYEQRMAGDIAQRQQSNQDITNTLINTFTPLVLDFLTMIFNLCLMLNYSVFMGLIGLASVGVNLLLAQIISDKRIDITRVQTRDNANVMSTTLQGINMIETIKSAGAENGFFTKWAGYQANANIQTAKFAMLNQTFGQIPPLLSQLTSSLILFFAVRLIMRGEWTIGLVSAFTGYLTAFSTPATALIQAGQKIQEMRTNMERVQDVFKYPVDVDYDKTPYTSDEDLNKLEGLIEMKNVTFGYNRLNPPLLKDFSMRVEPGRSVAIVGPSGCGKSTIAKLVTGLYPIWDGEILFDGKPMSAINRNVFTCSVACVNQDISLFEDTVANNISMWDKSIENFEIILAARDAGIHDDIIQREGDYFSEVSEGGRNFSGGQRQRIEIAGALAQDPTIIIMDEATSALDTKTEYDLIQSITRRGLTRIIISHRLSIIRDCDEIIVLKEGNVVDRGTHAELMQRCEYYTALVTNE